MDTAHERLPHQAAEPVIRLPPAPPKAGKSAAAKPEMNRQERVIYNAYLAMIAMIVAFLAVTGLAAWLGA
jgi:hypothetical protein